jgi:hypothetical protein
MNKENLWNFDAGFYCESTVWTRIPEFLKSNNKWIIDEIAGT